MRADRRVATHLAATLLAASSVNVPQRSAKADGGAPTPLAVVAGGFLIPSEQYESYAQKFTEIGCATLSFSDESTLSRPRPLDDGADALLSQVSSLAQEKGLAASSPLVLLGHSRGCKTVVAAASRTKRRVAALVLIDPVDKTGPDPSSVLGALSSLQVPTVVLGSGKSEYDCAPTGSNYIVFADALRRAGAPRLVGLLGRAGHTQFVDNRRMLLTDVCTTGRDPDALVREVALEATAAWAAAALSPTSGTGALREAAAALRARSFGASVAWEDGAL